MAKDMGISRSAIDTLIRNGKVIVMIDWKGKNRYIVLREVMEIASNVL